jgi:hypothetical protein
LVFELNANFFAENWQKSQKIVIISSAPDFLKFVPIYLGWFLWGRGRLILTVLCSPYRKSMGSIFGRKYLMPGDDPTTSEFATTIPAL